MLYLAPAFRERLQVPRRAYVNLADANLGLAAKPHEDGRRFDAPSQSAESLALALGSIELLSSAGWPAVHTRASELAERLAAMLADAGRPPAPRGASTLVSFPSEDPAAERQLLADAGVIVRNIPNRPWLRASVGAWNDEGDLERLVGTLAR